MNNKHISTRPTQRHPGERRIDRGPKHIKYDNLCAAAGTTFQPFARETLVATAP
jgi:hypothetical protein